MALPNDTILENRYRINQLLAEGGMGAIYRGLDTKLAIPVAIKENFFQTEQSIRQFEQEALILARLHHPNLPRVIDHFSFEDKQYLVMDYVEGQDLWQMFKLRGQPLDEREALGYLTQVCDAVSYLHRQNPPIIHRDIKPQNIKVTPEGRAVLVDFGIAKVAADDTRTRTGAQAVTPGFSPPEQYSRMGTTPVSDVYSLGATLYAVLTGQNPPDSVSLMAGGAKFEPPNVINSKLSRRVSTAIEHAMQVQREHRPQTVAEWQKDLKNILEAPATFQVDEVRSTDEMPTVMSSTAEPSTHAAPQVPTAPDAADAPPTGQLAKSSLPWLWIGLGGGVLVILIGVIAFLVGRSGAGDSEVNTQAILNALAATATEQARVGVVEPKFDLEATLVALAATATVQSQVEAMQLGEVPTETPTDTSTPEPTATSVPPTNTTTSEPTDTPPPPTFTPTPSATPTPAALLASSLQGTIAYPAFNGMTYDLYFGDISSGKSRLFRTEASQPAFNADGSRIAFLSWSGSSRGLITASSSGGNEILIATAVEDKLPTWSPDSSTILFLSRRSGGRQSELYSSPANVDFLSSEPQFVSEGEYPTWGVNGQVVFKGWGRTATGLRLTSGNFDNIESVTRSAEDFTPVLSPDGSQIAFTARAEGNWDIYIVNVNGSGLRRLTTNPARDGLPAWSPDGQAIAYVSERDGGKWVIVATDTGGSIQRELFEMVGSPDGKVFYDQANSTGWLEERISWAP